MSLFKSIYNYIKNAESDREKLGLEIEHFVIDKNGYPIGFEEVCRLIEKTGRRIGAEIVFTDGYPVGYRNEKYAVSLEPACQFEISISPYSELAEIEDVYREFYSLWEPVFAEHGYQMITKGILPLVESGDISPDNIPLSPKKRYQYMNEYFKTSGKYGTYMMRSSASTQVSIDYSSENDMVRKMRLLQILSPIFMIMMENKTEKDSSLLGNPCKTHLLRTQIWDDLDPARCGFYPCSFDEDFGYEKAAGAVYHVPLILFTDNGTTTYVGERTAEDLENNDFMPEIEPETDRGRQIIEHVLSMNFFHFRIKNYIEIRIADSVPLKKALGYAALIKGIAYSDSNLQILQEEFADIDSTIKIQNAVESIKSDGMDAVIYHGITARQWSDHIIELAANALTETEKKYLKDGFK